MDIIKTAEVFTQWYVQYEVPVRILKSAVPGRGLQGGQPASTAWISTEQVSLDEKRYWHKAGVFRIQINERERKMRT
jgi:hypothetical protein